MTHDSGFACTPFKVELLSSNIAMRQVNKKKKNKTQTNKK